MTQRGSEPVPDKLTFEHIGARRIVATPAAIDAVTWPTGTIALRIADDDVLLIGDDTTDITDITDITVADEHAIISDDAGWSGIWLTSAQAESIALHHIHWPLPPQRPILAQGLIAAIPAKVWLGADDKALLLVATVSVDEMQERLS